VIYSSVVFLFYFLPLVLAVYYMLPRLIYKNAILCVASLFFYAWGEGKLFILLLCVAFSAWAFAYIIYKTQYKKLTVFVAVICYILLLAYYKYFESALGLLFKNPSGALSDIKVLMPIGVSFFTFQAISYVLDVYRKPQAHEKNPTYIILYISMFPQLISGPLVKYEHMQAQLKTRRFKFDDFIDGIKRFIIGLAKKVLIANPLGLLVNEVMHTDMQYLGPSIAWIGIAAFTLQLFFDFSAYTDMAIGVGKMLGFNLPENFNYPYISRSITEFWRRWHITLSNWLRDYVFMPLSLNLRSLRKTGVFFSLFFTFILCGMWHSAGWNFFVWGAVHGLFLGLEFLFLNRFLLKIKAVSVIYTMFIIMLSFVFVATNNFEHALNYIAVMFVPASPTALGAASFIVPQHIALMFIGIFLSMPLEHLDMAKKILIKPFWPFVEIVFLIVIFLLSLMAVTSETYNPFLYFNF